MNDDISLFLTYYSGNSERYTGIQVDLSLTSRHLLRDQPWFDDQLPDGGDGTYDNRQLLVSLSEVTRGPNVLFPYPLTPETAEAVMEEFKTTLESQLDWMQKIKGAEGVIQACEENSLLSGHGLYGTFLMIQVYRGKIDKNRFPTSLGFYNYCNSIATLGVIPDEFLK